MNRYEWLIQDFEEKLQRELSPKELKWIQWITEKEVEELIKV